MKNENRKTGESTRRLDRIIQDYFQNGLAFVYDKRMIENVEHHDHALIEKFKERMKLEHPGEFFVSKTGYYSGIFCTCVKSATSQEPWPLTDVEKEPLKGSPCATHVKLEPAKDGVISSFSPEEEAVMKGKILEALNDHSRMGSVASHESGEVADGSKPKEKITIFELDIEDFRGDASKGDCPCDPCSIRRAANSVGLMLSEEQKQERLDAHHKKETEVLGGSWERNVFRTEAYNATVRASSAVVKYLTWKD